MSDFSNLPQDMEGIYHHKGSCSKDHSFRFKLPEKWGIDLVMLLLTITLTVLVILHWKAVLFYTAVVISKIIPVLVFVLSIVLVIVIVLAIRNKKFW